MVTLTSTLITQQSARHCSASPISYWTSTPKHNSNIKILTSNTQGKDTHFIVVPLGPTSFQRHYVRKAWTTYKFFFLFFFLFPFTQLPITFSHLHIKYLLSAWVLLPGFNFWSFSSGWWRYLHPSGDGGGTSTTPGDNLMEITSSSLQHKITHSINTHYTTQHSSNPIKWPVYCNYTHKPADIDGIPCPTMESTTNN